MNTNEFIDHLSEHVRPIAPLPRPNSRAVVWLTGGAVYVVVLTALMSRGASPNAWTVEFWLPQTGAVIASFLLARAAFVSIIPGMEARALSWAITAAGLWTVSLLASAGTVDFSQVSAAQREWICVGVTVLGGMPLMVALAAMLRRGAALSPNKTAALAALAAGVLANVAACGSLAHGNGAVTWVWHGAAVVIAAVASAALGQRILSWRTGTPPAR